MRYAPIAVLCLVCIPCRADEVRQWKAGDFSERGTFVSLVGDVVTIRLVGGDEVDVDLARLSVEDQAYAKAAHARKDSPFRPKVRGDSGEAVARAVTTNSIGMNLVRIPAGEFEMGSDDGDADERPVHVVRITKPFLIGQTEVTQGQWHKVMGTAPWRGRDFSMDGANFAATYVTWDQAVEFCRRLTDMDRRAGRLPGTRACRLPTEAEWEYACRAGTKKKWSFGDDEGRLVDHAWADGLLQNVAAPGPPNDEQYAHEVGRKKPNPWGLHDMHGNAFEWCNDGYDARYYANSPAADPKGPSPVGPRRVLRGGGWSVGEPGEYRSANRSGVVPDTRLNFDVGFRVVVETE